MPTCFHGCIASKKCWFINAEQLSKTATSNINIVDQLYYNFIPCLQDGPARSETSSESDVASLDWEDSDSISSELSSSSDNSGSVNWEVHVGEQAGLSKGGQQPQSTSLKGFRLRDEEGDDLAEPSRKVSSALEPKASPESL